MCFTFGLTDVYLSESACEVGDDTMQYAKPKLADFKPLKQELRQPDVCKESMYAYLSARAPGGLKHLAMPKVVANPGRRDSLHR